uniref:Methylenetetrahydrofolate reductase [NAD(P)H] n=1 Tax=Globodera pallida TaxID=36090 RepID=A0A183CHN4_GLOPA
MLASLINDRHRQQGQCSPFFSLEFYPPLKDQPKNMSDFFDMLNYLKQAQPLFVDITWSRRNDPGNLCKLNSSSAIAIATADIFGKERTMLHICCNDHTKAESVSHVEQTLGHGIPNIMALRGDDLPEATPTLNGQLLNTKHYATELVKWTRQLEGARGICGDNRLTVAVAGHIFSPIKTVSYGQCMEYLRAKVDAGADFIVTQFFLDANLFEQFRVDCRSIGISVPILPGILLFKSAASLRKIAELSNVPIPQQISQTLKQIGSDTVAVQNYAVQLAYDMCRNIFSAGHTTGIHIFTLNQRDMCGKLLKRLGFWPTMNLEISAKLNDNDETNVIKKEHLKISLNGTPTRKSA